MLLICHFLYIIDDLQQLQQRFRQMKSIGKCHRQLVMGGKTDDVGYIPTCLNVCPWTLLTVITDAVLIGNRLLHSLKGMAGSEGHSWTLGVRIVFLEPVPSNAMQCFCCYHRRPKEGNIFHALPMASGRGSTITFNIIFCLKKFWEKLFENKDFHNAKS